ncbi:helix-turn-helix domain-containing protein [Anaerocolumna sedimenticola]|uniref:Helix-turn-helix domain-containing protein n=1 Tax=Anaerocolumna sedimenticola TaxID=2696063 RepID=A0A6P1TI00_9FIRM|nr:helix-turn-helix domain-containing protein [Anaerocolumna sedimenticola]QHQ60840.1 helix-turn-helix domain-containing protein [Anaerocolumna sedimenticola]
MDNREIIQNSIDYIEENLKTEITAYELSENAGFSIYHYYRLFQSAVGMPVMQYIIRRKLINAVYDTSQGQKMINTALIYGFDTHAGFYKAFKREFGYTPSEFLKKYKAKKPYRINLFKEEHIMVTHKKVSEVLKKWGLQNETIKDIYYEKTGNHNDSAYYVGNDYVIKFTANVGKLKNHIELSKAIENVGLWSATVIRTEDGKEYIQDGELYFYLTKRLNGSQIKSGDIYEGDYDRKGRFVGEIIGQLHLALKEADIIVNDVDMYENVKNWAMPKVRELMNLPDYICKDYIEVFGNLYPKLPKQIIHRDPNPGNIIVNNERWGFIDFELSERNLRIYDPCYAATAVLSENFSIGADKKLTQWIELCRSIIEGYDSVVKLSEEERKAIPYVILSNQLICVAWFSEQEKYKEIYQINKAITNWIVNNFDKLHI